MSLQQFSFENHEIRTIIEANESWFAAKDVCAAMDISWRGEHSLEGIKEGWRMVRDYRTIQGERETYFISEPAVYKLAFRSRKPEAERFTDWLASEVLPALRKTGTYQIGQAQGTAPTISMTLPDGTRIEGLPVSAVRHLIPQSSLPPLEKEVKQFQPSLQLERKHKPGERLYDYEGSVKGVRSGWYSLAELSSRIGCKPKTLNSMILKRKLPRTWGSRWSKGQWWVYLP